MNLPLKFQVFFFICCSSVQVLTEQPHKENKTIRQRCPSQTEGVTHQSVAKFCKVMSLSLWFPPSCSGVTVERGWMDSNSHSHAQTHTHTCTHAHTRVLWSRQAQTTGTHVEQVCEQTFIPTLSCSMRKRHHSNVSSQFSSTHPDLYLLPAPRPQNPVPCYGHISSNYCLALFICKAT